MIQTATGVSPDAYSSHTHARPWRWSRFIVLPLVALLAISAVLGIAYRYGLDHYTTHFLPHTSLNGVDVSNRSVDDVAAEIDALGEQYTNNIQGDTFQLTITGPQIDLKGDGDACVTEAMAQLDIKNWPFEMTKAHELVADQHRSFDEEGLRRIVDEAVNRFNETAIPPLDARVSYQENEGIYAVVADSLGGVLDSASVADRAIKQVQELKPTTELGPENLARPALESNNPALTEVAAFGNNMLSVDIPLVVGGEEKARVNHDLIASWLTLDESYVYDISDEGVLAWLDEVLTPAARYNDPIYTWNPDNYELRVMLQHQIRAFSSEPLEIPMYAELRIPDETPGARELGRHIDINLATQYARLYDETGAIIWESYIVSGQPSDYKDHSSPVGSYQIVAKMTDQTLIGLDEDLDNKPDYESYVNYWMPFIGNSVGLHDATWRSSFGGTIYTYYGSHGCINLPYEKAEQLYGIIQVGDRVITHF